MNEITLKIPDEKLQFFLELMEQLGFELAGEVEVPEAHREIVRERMRTARQGELVEWDKVKGNISTKK